MCNTLQTVPTIISPDTYQILYMIDEVIYFRKRFLVPIPTGLDTDPAVRSIVFTVIGAVKYTHFKILTEHHCIS